LNDSTRFLNGFGLGSRLSVVNGGFVDKIDGFDGGGAMKIKINAHVMVV
jgi:hypothetical protein